MNETIHFENICIIISRKIELVNYQTTLNFKSILLFTTSKKTSSGLFDELEENTFKMHQTLKAAFTALGFKSSHSKVGKLMNLLLDLTRKWTTGFTNNLSKSRHYRATRRFKITFVKLKAQNKIYTTSRWFHVPFFFLEQMLAIFCTLYEESSNRKNEKKRGDDCILHGFNFRCRANGQRVIPSGQDGSILSARVANHSAGFDSSWPLEEPAI